MKESKIQEKTVELLRENGYLCMLIEYRGKRFAPDCMVFNADFPGRVAFLELKTMTGKRSPGQVTEAELYLLCGHDVGVPRTPVEALAHCNKVFYGNKGDEADPAHVRHLPREKAVSRVSDSIN